MFTQSLLARFPITILTLLQFVNGKAIRFVAGFALLPTLFGLIFLLDSGGNTAREFLDDVFREFVVPTILPLATLVLATSALGNEIEDRTLVYLFLKPVSRLRIVIEKLSAVAEATVLTLWLGLIVVWLVAAQGQALDSVDVLVTAAVAILCGVLAYGALFLTISLVIPRALLVGIVYTLLWEGLLSRIIPGARILSIRHYAQSIYARILDDPEIAVSNAMQLTSALIVLLVLVVLAVALATLRLRSMDLE